jgi:hypothetical protein
MKTSPARALLLCLLTTSLGNVARASEPIPLASVLRTATGEYLLVPQPAGIALQLRTQALKDPGRHALVLSMLESPEALNTVAMVSSSFLQAHPSCWVSVPAWDGALDVLRRGTIYKQSRLEELLSERLAQQDCAKVTDGTSNVPAMSEGSFFDWLFDRQTGRGWDSLAYLQNTIPWKAPVLESDSGTLEVVGNITLLRFEDPAQEKSSQRWASRFSQAGMDAGLRWSNPSRTTSVMLLAHLYDYRDSGGRSSTSDTGREVVLAYQTRVTEYFWIIASAHAGRGGRYEDKGYVDLRVMGRYVPKFWR